MYLGRRGWGLQEEYEVWDWTFVRKEVSWDFFLDHVPNCRGPVFPRVLPYLVPDVSGSITMRHLWLSYYFKNSLDLPCVCFWCYMYKGKENHNGLHVTKSMWVLKAASSRTISLGSNYRTEQKEAPCHLGCWFDSSYKTQFIFIYILVFEFSLLFKDPRTYECFKYLTD